MKWVTGKGMDANRAATAWLIRRFLDPEAEIVFADPADVARIEREERAVVFAPDDDRASFERLVGEQFAAIPAMRALARIVGGVVSPTEMSAPESIGVWAISEGFSNIAASEEEISARAMFIFDCLLAHLERRYASGESLTLGLVHDVATGLPNQALFIDRLGLAIGFANRHGAMLAVMRIGFDLAQAERHIVRVLQEITDRLVHSVREIDTIARLTENEFALAITNLHNREEAILVAEKIAETVLEPFDLDAGPVALPVSIGVSLYPPHGHDPQALLTTSAEALERAKQKGSAFALFTEE